MNNNVEANLRPQIGSFASPLLICGAGIVCSCLALATYHFILFRFCVHSEQEFEEITIPSPSPPLDIPCGVDPEILDRIPILSYSPNKDQRFRSDQNECVICLGDLEHGEKLRLLPSCNHAFHIPCIDLWFSQHTNCPICRSPLVVTTTSSPSALPMPQNDAQQSLSDHHHHLPCIPNHHRHKLASHLTASGSGSQASPPVLLQHSLSLSCHTQEKPQDLVMGLRRSLSMDQSSYISIVIQRDQEKPSTSSSPSRSSSSATTGVGISRGKGKPISIRHLDQVSSMLMTSLSQFRNTTIQRSQRILPN